MGAHRHADPCPSPYRWGLTVGAPTYADSAPTDAPTCEE